MVCDALLGSETTHVACGAEYGTIVTGPGVLSAGGPSVLLGAPESWGWCLSGALFSSTVSASSMCLLFI